MIVPEQFHFIRPEWFYALLPLALLWVALRLLKRRQSGWQSVIAKHLYQHMITGKATTKGAPPFWLLALGWLIGVTALAGPTWEQLPQPVFQVKAGHVVVMDMSLSLRATDVTPDRLTRAKYKAVDLVNAIDEGDMGLVAYAGDAFVISPLTEDAATLTTLLPSLSPEIMPVPGSNPLRGLEVAADLLTNAGYQEGTLYWVTDGVELQEMKAIRDFIASIPFQVDVLAVGTEQGAPIKLASGELMKQTNGAIVIPKLRTSNLVTLSRASGGQFTEITPDETDIKRLTDDNKGMSAADKQEDKKENTGDQWKEAGPYLVLLLLPFAAYAFRRGIIACVVIGLFMTASPQSAMAQTTSTPTQAPAPTAPPALDKIALPTADEAAIEEDAVSWWQAPFLNRDQQGLKNYTEDKYHKALNQFDDPMWRGSAAYKAGDYEGALQAFNQVDSAEAWYNQGNALAQLQEFDKAIAAYDKVLAENPEHADAKANKALLEQLKQQQEQQEQQDKNNQQQDSEQQDQDQQQNQGQQQDGEQSDQQQSDSQQQNQQQQGEQKPEDNNDTQQGQDKQDQQQQEQQESESQQQADDEQQQSESEAEAAQAEQRELTPEEKEVQQRLDNLLRRVPDDPAFLLKRKMQLEAQKRRRERVPSSQRSDW